MKTMTLNAFIKAHNLPKPLDCGATDESTIQEFVVCRKAYTLLPEYLAHVYEDGSGYIKALVRGCQRQAAKFNLDSERLIQLTFAHCINIINSEK